MFCIPFKRKVKALLLQIDSYVDAHVTTALQITSAIKSLLSSPAADIITAIIPGDLDNILQQQAIRALEKLADALSIADTCRQCDTTEKKLQCFIAQLQHYDPHLQDAILLKLASLLAGMLDGDRLKQSLYDTYTQAKYAAGKL
jgi:hypothetical protein